jgi:hypothetical protein
MSPNAFFFFDFDHHILPGWQSKFVMYLYPDTRICSPSKSYTGIQKWLRAKLYRDRCAGGFDLNPLPGFDSARPKHCTAMAPACHQIRTRIGKNCAMLRSLQLWWHYLHSQDTCHRLHSAQQHKRPLLPGR